jgi:hypothetical protein
VPVTPSDPEIDPNVAHPARVYDWLLGGTNNFEVDRAVAERGAAAYIGLDAAKRQARVNRDFLGRAVRYLAGEADIRQFLDIGSGLPTEGNVHEIAQQVAPDSAIVYVDNDPLVLKHANQLLSSTREGSTTFIIGDFFQPHNILLRAEATLDFSAPMALILSAVLHHFPDATGDKDPYRVVKELVDALSPGSYLMLSHLTADWTPDAAQGLARELESSKSSMTFTLVHRTREQIAGFLTGLELVEPGIVPVTQWRHDDPDPRVGVAYGVVARKP